MRHLSGIFSNIKRYFSELSVKKVIIAVLITFLILAPTFFAASYVLYHEFLYQGDMFSVTIYDNEGNQLGFEEASPEGAAKSSLTNIFYQLMQESTNTSPSSIVEAQGDRFIRAVTKYNGVSSEIKCFFSAKEGSAAYFTNNKNQKITIPNDINKLFLSTPYGELFFDSSVPYSLSTIDMDTITPSKITWYYKDLNGEYLSAARNAVQSNQMTYEITGAIDISFESFPDKCTVKVYDQDGTSHDSTLEDLSTLTIDSGDDLRVTILAEWTRKRDSDKYGQLYYDFLVRIKNRSSFSISSEKVSAGGFLILDCTNITDISKIKFTSSVKDIQPSFKQYNGNVRAIIPFPENVTYNSLSFDISYGVASESFTVSISKPDKKDEFFYDSMIFDSEGIPSDINKKTLRSILETKLPNNDPVYFRGNFASPADYGFDTLYTHGATVSFGEEYEYSFTAFGNEYTVGSKTSGGLSVRSLQNGVVSLVGNDEYLGKFIVIDHGCGLRTWYAGLDDIDVNAGEIVVTGQHLGKTAEGTFKGVEGFKLYCSIYDTVISPNQLWN